MSIESLIIDVAKETRQRLSGKLLAQKDYAKFCDLLAGVAPGLVVVLDFRKVEYVSGSWVNWALMPLIRLAAEERNDFYVVAKNFPKDSLDDLQLVSEQNRFPVIVVPDDKLRHGVIYGILDPVQRETLQSVVSRGEVTGASLATKTVTGPAWNNRLKDLSLKRLLRRRKEGREQIYSSLILEVRVNG